MSKPLYPQTTDTKLRGLLRRLESLERRLAASTAGGGGIQFDTSPQTGGFLEAYTLTGGIDLEDQSGDGLTLISDNGSGGGFITIATGLDGEIFIAAGAIVNRPSDDGNFEVQYSDGSQFLFMDTFDGSVLFRLKTGHTFHVNGPTSTLLLGVNEDGSLDAPNLPIADPGVTGRLWNNSGVVTVSP